MILVVHGKWVVGGRSGNRESSCEVMATDCVVGLRWGVLEMERRVNTECILETVSRGLGDKE